MKKKSKDDGEPTWVKHPVHGWLPDECPVFSDPRAGSGVITQRWELFQLVGFCGPLFPIDGIAIADTGFGSWGEAECLIPLTTAARDLLAALKQEAK